MPQVSAATGAKTSVPTIRATAVAASESRARASSMFHKACTNAEEMASAKAANGTGRLSSERLGLRAYMSTTEEQPTTAAPAIDYDSTFVYFEEGDVVSGNVVRIDRDEVLVDIGYKSEGVIPSHELSIRKS